MYIPIELTRVIMRVVGIRVVAKEQQTHFGKENALISTTVSLHNSEWEVQAWQASTIVTNKSIRSSGFGQTWRIMAAAIKDALKYWYIFFEWDYTSSLEEEQESATNVQDIVDDILGDEKDKKEEKKDEKPEEDKPKKAGRPKKKPTETKTEEPEADEPSDEEPWAKNVENVIRIAFEKFINDLIEVEWYKDIKEMKRTDLLDVANSVWQTFKEDGVVDDETKDIIVKLMKEYKKKMGV